MTEKQNIDHKNENELEGLLKIAEALSDKTREEKIRMVHWAADKFCGCALVYKSEAKTKPL